MFNEFCLKFLMKKIFLSSQLNTTTLTHSNQIIFNSIFLLAILSVLVLSILLKAKKKFETIGILEIPKMHDCFNKQLSQQPQ